MAKEITETLKQVESVDSGQERIILPYHERYLKNLKQQLEFLTEKWWAELADALLQTVSTTSEYKEANEWITKEELAKREFDINLSRLTESCKGYYREEAHSYLEWLIKFFEENEELILTEDQYNKLRNVIEVWDFTDELRPIFWGICIERFIKEEDRKSVFKAPLREFKLQKLEEIIQISNDKGFIYDMFLSIVFSWMIDKISQETNTKFFNTLFINSEDKANILKWFLSEKCNLEECLEKLDPQMEEALKYELKNEEILKIIISNLVTPDNLWNFITLLESFGIAITSSVLLSFRVKFKWKRISKDNRDRLGKLVPESEIKNTLKEMFENWNEENVVGLTYLFRSIEGGLWWYVDKKYRIPKYLNPHMKIISEGFGLSNEDRIWLLNDLKASENFREKYNACLIVDDMLKNVGDELIDLIIDTVELDENSNPILLYAKMKIEWELDEEIMFNIVKNIDRMYGVYDFEGRLELRNAIKQWVYDTKNEKLIIEFIKNFWRFKGICKEEEIDTFITKFIHVMKYEHIKIFNDIMSEDLDYKNKIKSSLLFKIRYFAGRINVSKRTSLPKDVYIDAIKTGKLGLYGKLPEVDAKSSYIHEDDLNKILGILKAYDDKRSKNKLTQIVQETIKNWENWEIIFNFTEQEQKYILSIDYERWCLRFITENLDYHARIHRKYVGDDGECVWGWRVRMDEEKKIITLFGHSQDFGSVVGDYKEAMKKMLENRFPDYVIEIQ